MSKLDQYLSNGVNNADVTQYYTERVNIVTDVCTTMVLPVISPWQCKFLLFIRVVFVVSGFLTSCQGSRLSLFLSDVMYVYLYFPICAVYVCHG